MLDALPAIEVKDMSNQQELEQNKVKEAYLQTKTPDTVNGTLSTPRALSIIQDNDESEKSDGKKGQLGGKDEELVDGQGQIVLDVRDDVTCCVPCPKKATGYVCKR